MDLDTDLTFVKGVGPARATILQAKGLRTVEDLLTYAPFRYEDRSRVKPVAELAPGEMATVLGEVRSARLDSFRRRSLGLFEATVSDSSRAILQVKWFNSAWLARVLAPGVRVSLFGKIELDSYTGRLAMMHPQMEVLSGAGEEAEQGLHTGRIVPVYQAIGKINTRHFRVLLHRVLETLPGLEDALPASLRRRLALLDAWTAVRQVHFPETGENPRVLNEFRTRAHYRLIFEEFFWLECGLAIKRRQAKQAAGIVFELKDSAREKIKAMLPFKPTGAQKRVLKEIADDMASARPMNRLLQGDVGSGKTLVAAEAAVIAIENGYQVAVLAPTEILAQQHYFYFRRLMGRIGYVVALLTGSHTAREKKQLKKLAAEGLAHVLIGTHAILEEDVEFRKLGLAIVDEQHRFGVMQRLKLLRKGPHPDVLVMTATPIPRTLALTLYGDLDVSIIDELPPGRRPVITRHVTEDQLELVWSFVRREIEHGRQAYVVYPVIDEGETQAMRAATEMHEHLDQVVFPDLEVGLLHGRLSTADKESAMERFQRGETRILVSTTVIEVGVDVPNATVMVIEQAERFGLAQLHQLRGRVGRSHWQSHCVLVTQKLNEAGQERIRTMVESNDGFYIADVDLKLRGPGEFFGTKQAGLPSLRIADLIRDSEILEHARREANDFIENPPSPEEGRRAIAYLREKWQRRYGLVQVG